jgi:hypothetical protein
MRTLELTPRTFRRARTRTLIQLGGLVEKAGLMEAFGLRPGADLQKDEAMKTPMLAFFGAMLEVGDLLKREKGIFELWTLKGRRAFLDNESKEKGTF